MVFHIEDALKVFHQSTQGGDASLFDGVKTGVHRRPHLTDPDWPQDNSPAKQPEGTGTTQKGNEEDERKSRSKQCYSLMPLWEPFQLKTGAGLGRVAGRSC